MAESSFADFTMEGLIDEIASCREVIDTILAEAEQIIGTRLPSYLS